MFSPLTIRIQMIISVGLLLPTLALAQNQPPQISNFSAVHNKNQGEVTITYDLADAENDDAKVLLKASSNGGATYDIPVSNSIGDVGYPVSPGTGKQIIWDYPNSLSSAIDTYHLKLVASLNIQEIVNQVDSQRLKNTLQVIEGVRHPDDGLTHLKDVKDTIEARFQQHGLDTNRQTFSIQGSSYTGENIIGSLQGQTAEDTTYVIDAHFDGVQGSPAADDNASGVAGVLEAARLLADYNFKHTIRFIGFDQEEAGLLGSEAYVNFGIGNSEYIEGVFNFEMIGYYSEQKNSQTFPNGFDLLFPNAYSEVQADSFRGDFIANIANDSSISLKNAFDSAAAKYVPGLDLISIDVDGTGTIAPDLRRSDHANFWDENYKALMLTNTSEFRNPNYHTANDTMGSLNFTFMADVVKATVGAVCKEAGIQNSSSATTDIQESTSSVDASHKKPNPVTLYPNPTENKIHIHFAQLEGEGVQIKLYNSSGQLVSAKREGAKNQKTVTMDASELQQGVYHIAIDTDDQQLRKKVVIY